MASLVYFIRAQESGRIKIGIAADPVKRLSALQVGSPEHLELIAVRPGGRALERRLHARFAEYRLAGEWFRPGVGLLEFIAPKPSDAQVHHEAEVERLTRISSTTASIAAHTSWANTTDRAARTAPARRALEDRFLADADGDPRRAESMRKAYFKRLALQSVQARRRKKEA